MATTQAAAKSAMPKPRDIHETLAKSAGTPLPAGIYFGLDAAIYHADPGLGSGDVRRLLRGISAFWYESKFNPFAPEDTETKARIEGSAIHSIVLEGMPAFRAGYVRRKDDPPGATASEKGTLTKRAKADLKEGEHLLHGDEYDRTLLVAGEIASNPDVATAFQNGMPEVAVFWDEPVEGAPPVRCKALLDYLKIRGIGDLKTIANELQLEFDLAVRRSIRYQRMAVQAALYMRGRKRFSGMLASGQVHGTVDMDWLAKVCATPPAELGWQWIFYQRNGAPEVASKKLSPKNPLLTSAHEAVDEALFRYARALQELGTDKPWRKHVQVTELTEDELAHVAGEY